MSTPTDQAAGKAGIAKDQAAGVRSSTQDQAGAVVDTSKDQAAQVVSDAKGTAQDLLSQSTEQISAQADEQTQRLSHNLLELSQQLSAMSGVRSAWNSSPHAGRRGSRTSRCDRRVPRRTSRQVHRRRRHRVRPPATRHLYPRLRSRRSPGRSAWPGSQRRPCRRRSRADHPICGSPPRRNPGSSDDRAQRLGRR